MVALPLLEATLRTFFETGVPGAVPFVQHLSLWVGFLGASMAARQGRLLRLATGEILDRQFGGRSRPWIDAATAVVGAGVSALLAHASWAMLQIDRDAGGEIAAGVPVWVGQLVLPIAFLLIALRMAWRAGNWPGRVAAFAALAAGVAVGMHPEWAEGIPTTPGLLILVLAGLLGAPIFAVLGGLALLYFLADYVPPAAVPAELYRMARSPTLPAIPLFTLAGFLLSEGNASHRLLGVFRAAVGWLPGGTAMVCALLCAFFTAFTGGSGITILALGGLLFAALKEDGYREQFSLGLLTSSGSLGLLFPPALPVILYAVVAQIPILDLFKGGLVPGALLVAMVAGWGVWEGVRRKIPRSRFSLRPLGRAIWVAKWEMALPVVVGVAIFGGFATPIQASALAAAYAMVTQIWVHRDIKSLRRLVEVFEECLVLVGGVIVILGVALGLTNYLVDAQVPARLLEWVSANIDSPLVFLIYLNLFLLVVGCLMDIFSATVVVVPLILPLGAAFGIDPIHLGIIFIANLELGYLTPPVGLNLFLASYRFDRPLLKVWRSALVPLVLLAMGVLLITYVPFLTTWGR